MIPYFKTVSDDYVLENQTQKDMLHVPLVFGPMPNGEEVELVLKNCYVVVIGSNSFLTKWSTSREVHVYLLQQNRSF